MKKVISIVLCVALMLSTVTFAVPFSAAEADIAQSASQQNDIVAVAQGEIGGPFTRVNKYTQWYYGYDNAQDWCAIFVSWCASKAGISADIVPRLAGAHANFDWFKSRGLWHGKKAITWTYNGKTRSSENDSSYVPRAGDIILRETYGGVADGPDHVELVTGCDGNRVYTIGGNTGSYYNSGVYYSYVKSKSYSLWDSDTWGYCSPAYENSYIDVGTNFYAYIINTATWLHATNNETGNVAAGSVAYSSDKIWYFERLNNGSYKITSCKDGRCMEVHNFESANGTNVEMNSYGNNTAQHWFISGNSAEYVFRAECGNNVLNLNGSNLQMWESNGSDAQKFQIWKLTAPNLGTANVSVSNYGGENGENIKLSWNECQDATGYDIRIYDESGTNNIKMFYNVKGTSYTISLPSGNYIAEVTALNSRFNTWKFGTRTSFSCANNLGSDFYGYIINTASWKHLGNDGNHHAIFDEQINGKNKIWHFVLNDNGSYTIYSLLDNNVLDVDSDKSESGADVGVWQYNNSSNQEWYIYGSSAVYYFKPNSSDCVLDMEGGIYYDGVNAQVFEKNNTDAQKFQIWRLSKPEATLIECEAGTDSTATIFSWTVTYNTNSYELNIWKDTNIEADPYLTVDCGNKNDYEIVLPVGHYIANVTSVNSTDSTESNYVEFEIETGHILGDADGSGQVDIVDAVWIQRHIAKREMPDSFDEQAAEIDGDGEITIIDVLWIQRYLAKMAVPYSIGQTIE